ncbi:hypothetical protein HanPI659440_Chr13g0485841 [Helianthus annuus]|nr:hypothetical protein HanPI659440_Chr13g0485841 [Helianthus annuus]
MATLPHPPLSSSSPFCSSITSINFNPTQHISILDPHKTLLSAVSSYSKLHLIHPQKLNLDPILLYSSGFKPPLDTQTFLATISVLVAISLSLFLGLKGDPVPCEKCAGNGIFFIIVMHFFYLIFVLRLQKKKKKKKKD